MVNTQPHDSIFGDSCISFRAFAVSYQLTVDLSFQKFGLTKDRSVMSIDSERKFQSELKLAAVERDRLIPCLEIGQRTDEVARKRVGRY